MKFNIKIEERFWSKVNKTNNCWLWEASKNLQGYGHFNKQLAHRFSYELHFGNISKGLLVLHKCDNPACVRPDHLFLGTQKDNIQDMIKKGRQFDRSGENHGRSKLSNEEVKKIRLESSLHNKLELCKKYNVSLATIYRIINYENWDHV